MKIAIFDTETTGLTLPSVADKEKQPKIIEIGIAVVENNVVVKRYNQLINPKEEITSEITKITGITNDDVAKCPEFKDVYDDVKSIFDSCEIGIAHNAPFDTAMFNNECSRNNLEQFMPNEIICTVQEYTHEFGKRPKLTELYKKIIGSDLKQTHRAIDDVDALVECLIKDNFFEKIGV